MHKYYIYIYNIYAYYLEGTGMLFKYYEEGMWYVHECMYVPRYAYTYCGHIFKKCICTLSNSRR